MPRIPAIDPATATGAAADQLALTRKMFGATPNMFTTAAQSPAALTAMNAFFAALGKGQLGGKVGEQVAIAVAQTNGCEYCLAAHTAIGGMRGVSAADLGDAELAAARVAGLVDGEIVEVVAHVALNIFTNYFNNLAGTDVDFPRVALETAA